uniref:Uncharacterized protein n=1 Tax=Rhizophora mucronata TaxID=61149 RepID=A0A2P2P8M5_RHIMU
MYTHSAVWVVMTHVTTKP